MNNHRFLCAKLKLEQLLAMAVIDLADAVAREFQSRP
jgi:hypothetical protein